MMYLWKIRNVQGFDNDFGDDFDDDDDESVDLTEAVIKRAEPFILSKVTHAIERFLSVSEKHKAANIG